MNPTHRLPWFILPFCVASCAGSPTALHDNEPSLAAVGTANPAEAPRTARYVLLEPLGKTSAAGLPLFREIDSGDPRRAEVDALLSLPYLQWILDLGDASKRMALARCPDEPCRRGLDHPAYFVLTPGGNRPRQGLSIADPDGVRNAPHSWYVEVDPRRAATLIPHEYGHVMLAQQLPGEVPEHPPLLPHTTGAITNDIVALSEGWGIHFETLLGDRREVADVYARLHRDGFATRGPVAHGDSMLAVKDLFSYSQSYRRHGCIKENCFAYLPRPASDLALRGDPKPEDVLARWTDTTYDPARVRSLEQMVASEGLIAALFYRLATAPSPGGASGHADDPPLPDPERYAAMLAAFSHLTKERLQRAPAVLVFLRHLLEASDPRERERIARIALEVFHYTLTIEDAEARYAELHEAGHRLDMSRFRTLLAELESAWTGSVEELVTDPSVLETAAAPEIWLSHPSLEVGISGMGLPAGPLVFDLNTAPVEVLMTVPGIGYRRALAVVEARRATGGLQSISALRAHGFDAALVRKLEAMQTVVR